MKSDLDRLMDARGMDVLLTLPGENEDPYRTYLANGVDFAGLVVKKRGAPPVLVCNPMERDEAAKSGLTVYTYEDFGRTQLMADYRGEPGKADAEWYRRILDKTGAWGKVGVYGLGDINGALRTIRLLESTFGDQIAFVTEPPYQTVFDSAYETKDPDEIARLREVGRLASATMRAAREWIASHRAGDGIVIKADGSPLLIGDVKRFVRQRLFEQNLENPEDMIFSQGRDSAVPHSKGDDSAPIRLGETIIFDLFPRQSHGYFHDMTRTWCVGYASPDVQMIYDTVMEAYRLSAVACKPGVLTSTVQEMVCEYFEDLGHPTVLNTPGTQDGYVHSLAHGLGLNVHEAPYFRSHSSKHTLQPGNVFTLEPGLYYPDRGYAVRIEDTVYLNDAGELETLTDCPYDLVIELKGS
jgi:Xaa-Pro aminopeptidase